MKFDNLPFVWCFIKIITSFSSEKGCLFAFLKKVKIQISCCTFIAISCVMLSYLEINLLWKCSMLISLPHILFKVSTTMKHLMKKWISRPKENLCIKNKTLFNMEYCTCYNVLLSLFQRCQKAILRDKWLHLSLP